MNHSAGWDHMPEWFVGIKQRNNKLNSRFANGQLLLKTFVSCGQRRSAVLLIERSGTADVQDSSRPQRAFYLCVCSVHHWYVVKLYSTGQMIRHSIRAYAWARKTQRVSEWPHKRDQTPWMWSGTVTISTRTPTFSCRIRRRQQDPLLLLLLGHYSSGGFPQTTETAYNCPQGVHSIRSEH